MFFRLLHLACGLMIVLLGLKIYAIAGDLTSATPDDPSSSVTSAAMAQPAPSPPQPASGASPVQLPVPTPAPAAIPIVPTASLCAANTCKGPVMPPPGVSPADPALRTQLAEREKELDHRSAQLDDRQRLVDAAEAELQRRMTALDASRSALEESEHHSDVLLNQDADRLVRIYEAMKPADAAAIFNVLDLRVGVALLNRMNARKASAIMEAMSPQRAILVTQLLANAHVHPAAVVSTGGNG
ncbi:MotE family protein [Gluconobacter morbifer]|uniref:Magnesium transporter MgtE intracellular domain-containing protein n=1 Tax=Gluconobacter morbifer G707 TaxID=1088869 RepID=G6XJ95_9PROT|nr:hypothetical protein [Gluconobacter morbifer]EHH68211.1 hypothetical protein GMO_15610 [Gluconobacter morbifer G707]